MTMDSVSGSTGSGAISIGKVGGMMGKEDERTMQSQMEY